MKFRKVKFCSLTLWKKKQGEKIHERIYIYRERAYICIYRFVSRIKSSSETTVMQISKHWLGICKCRFITTSSGVASFKSDSWGSWWTWTESRLRLHLCLLRMQPEYPYVRLQNVLDVLSPTHCKRTCFQYSKDYWKFAQANFSVMYGVSSVRCYKQLI